MESFSSIGKQHQFIDTCSAFGKFEFFCLGKVAGLYLPRESLCGPVTALCASKEMKSAPGTPADGEDFQKSLELRLKPACQLWRTVSLPPCGLYMEPVNHTRVVLLVVIPVQKDKRLL